MLILPTWILLVMISGGVAPPTPPGFYTKAACENAAQAIVKMTEGVARDARVVALCIASGAEAGPGQEAFRP